MIRMARPAHPGQFIRMEIIEPLALSVTKAAEIIGVTRPALSALLNGRASLSPDMALRIEKAFGLGLSNAAGRPRRLTKWAKRASRCT